MQKKIRIYTKENRPYKTDWELVENAQKGEKAAYEEMWDKYYNLRQKEKFSFVRWCQSHNIKHAMYQDYIDTWDSDAYEKFYNQMAGVRLNDLKKKNYTPEKWCIAIRLIGYFHVVNRSYTTKLLNKLNKETNEHSVNNKNNESTNSTTNIDLAQCEEEEYNEDGIKTLAKDVFNKAWQNVLNEMDDKQRSLIQMKADKKKSKDICKALNVSPDVVRTYTNYSKSRLQHWIEKVSKNEGIPMTYKDIVSALS